MHIMYLSAYRRKHGARPPKFRNPSHTLMPNGCLTTTKLFFAGTSFPENTYSWDLEAIVGKSHLKVQPPFTYFFSFLSFLSFFLSPKDIPMTQILLAIDYSPLLPRHSWAVHPSTYFVYIVCNIASGPFVVIGGTCIK